MISWVMIHDSYPDVSENDYDHDDDKAPAAKYKI